jgi:SAM-dependent methyltransferase
MWRLLAYKLENRDRFAEIKHRAFVQLRERLERQRGGPVTGAVLVEIGCGQWLSNVKLFAAMGNEVHGVDPELPPRSLGEYPSFVRRCGAQRALKTLLNELWFKRRFEERLAALSGLGVQGARPHLHRGGAESLALPDSSVDAVVSDVVFQHLPDVAGATREIARVLRPGGLALIVIHPYAALSGGHHVATFSHGGPEAAPVVPPWDHLRKQLFPSGVQLNRLRAHEYRGYFEQHLTTVSWETLGPEGEAMLTDEIAAELSAYSREELLTGKIIYLGRKESGPPVSG